MKIFGWEDPIGKLGYMFRKSYHVAGDVKDFHPFSVHNQIPTYVMFLNSNVMSGTKVLNARYIPGNEPRAKQIITSELESIIPNDPFEFKDFSMVFFMDGAITFWQAMKKMFMFFAVVTLVVSLVRLFGLMLFTVRRQTKEIG